MSIIYYWINVPEAVWKEIPTSPGRNALKVLTKNVTVIPSAFLKACQAGGWWCASASQQAWRESGRVRDCMGFGPEYHLLSLTLLVPFPLP